MAKITMIICDVKPCTLTANRDFQINGETLHVCGEGCYVRFWSREYQLWKQDPYVLQAKHTGVAYDKHSNASLRVLSK